MTTVQPAVLTPAAIRRVTLLFSGGVDSTAAALRLAEAYDCVDLVSYHNAYGHYHLTRTAARFRELNRLLPNRFSHEMISVRELFETLVIDGLETDYERYRSGFIWCLGCKIAMHVRTVAYNREKGITVVADGSSAETSEMVEQMPASVARIRRFYADHGIAFETPVYGERRESSIRALSEKGLRLGLRVGDRFLGTQPKCKPGELYYLPFLLLGSAMRHPEEAVVDFIDRKLALGDRWLRDYLQRRGIANGVTP